MAPTWQNARPLPKQYQHYVPQFILKNFSSPASPGAGGSSPARVPSGQRRTGSGSNGYMVNHVDMSVENATVEEKAGRRVFGQYNMYDDDTQSCEKQRRIEQKLGRLESDASGHFRKMLNAFNEHHRGIWLTRDEKNLIRKFLFVMKYRGPTFYERYRHSTLDTYSAEDKDELSAYMQQKGFSRPIDVWLDNIEKFIDLEMDDKLKWVSDLPTRIYSHDAQWAVMHCHMMYMAICTPSDPKGEFILTDNCYHVSEGPFNISTNLQTGESEVVAWVNFHEFTPVSPKLIIVLRSYLFPSEMEDVVNPKAKEQREELRSIVEASFGSIDKSLLAELPVSKARNNYTLLTNGELRMLPDEDGTFKPEHSFFFHFFPIGLAHVNRINGVFLENTDSCESIVFGSKDAFRHTLEWYLTDDEVFRKRVSTSPEDSRRICLTKLGRLLSSLGSSAELHMEEISHPVLTHDEMSSIRLEGLRQALPSLDDSPTEFMSLYQSLGGSKSSLRGDMDQAACMINLRIKIDVLSQGINEDLRQANRVRLRDIYRQFPRRRLWLYLKRWRLMELGQQHGVYDDSVADGPEDIVAKAWRMMKCDALNNMMYWAVGNDIFTRRPPGFEPWATITLDENGMRQFGKLQEFAFSRSITNCGIESVEAIATSYAARFRETAVGRIFTTRRRIISDDQLGELWVRIVIKDQFGSLCTGIVQEDVLNSFKEVFFTALYPTPPSFNTLYNY